MFGIDITQFEDVLAPFNTYLVSVAQVKDPPFEYKSALNNYIWTIDRNTIVEPIEKVTPPEDPLTQPTRLTLTAFDTFEYQPKDYEFDVLAIVINDSHPTKTASEKKVQEFIIIDEQHFGIRSTNRFNGLSNKFNTTIEINPPYPQAAALKTWMKTIEPELVAYKMKSTTAVGSILLVPFEDEIIPVANIKEQLSGQVFYVEAELSFARKDQHLCVFHCPSYKTLFSRYNVRREIYCTTCHRSILLTHKCHFEVIVKDNSGIATTTISDEFAEQILFLSAEEIYEITFVKKDTSSLLILQNQFNGKLFKIQMKRLYSKNQDSTPKFSILSVLEEKYVVHKSLPATIVDFPELKKFPIAHLTFDASKHQNTPNKCSSSSKKHSMKTRTSSIKKN
ncbi:hypothetical protein P3S68_026282 [Capsicum galapagoense]